MNVLVTGGAGFIGGEVAAAYARDGHRVVVLDDLSAGRRERVCPEAKFVEESILSADLPALLTRHQIEAVNHHAARVDLRASVRDPVSDARVNIEGSLRLFEACRAAGVRRVIFSSTGGAIYGEPSGARADETHPTEPVSPYGIAKLAVEKYLHYYSVEHGFETIVFRYANVYGPGQDGRGEAGVVAILLGRLLSGESPVIHGDGKQTRDFVFVEDCVEVNRRALTHRGSGVWNVGTGVETSVNELLANLQRQTGRSGAPIHDAPGPGEQRRSVLDGGKLLAEFGLSRYTPLSDGLARTVAAATEGRAA